MYLFLVYIHCTVFLLVFINYQGEKPTPVEYSIKGSTNAREIKGIL